MTSIFDGFSGYNSCNVSGYSKGLPNHVCTCFTFAFHCVLFYFDMKSKVLYLYTQYQIPTHPGWCTMSEIKECIYQAHAKHWLLTK